MSNTSDKSVQASVQRAIDNNQLFALKHISQLKDLIRLNITIIVDPNTSQNYSCMTLIQYAIKQNKADSLKYMLDVAASIAEEKNTPIKDFLKSDFKYENNNLLFLAIDFNSNSCLETLINFFREKDPNFSVDISDPFGESPLTRAIKLGNEESIKILLSNGANLFYFDQTKNKMSTFMPLLCVFFYNREKSKLKHILEECIKPCLLKQKEVEKDKHQNDIKHLEEKDNNKFLEILKEFEKMHFNENFLKVDEKDEKGMKIADLLKKKGLIEANNYLIEIDTNITPVEQILISTNHSNTKQSLNNDNDDSDNITCYFCHQTIQSGGKRCENCGIFYCDDCEGKHKCE